MMDKIELKRRGIMFVISAPSGCGKTTIAKKIIAEDPDINFSISATTRSPRGAEVGGKDYFFLSKNAFEEKVKDGGFLEYATVFGNLYGTPKDYVNAQINSGKDVLFDIDWQGGEQLMDIRREDVVSVFLLSPSLRELRMRLQKRSIDSDEVIDKRMRGARAEISNAAKYDYVVINKNLEDAFKEVCSILKVERSKIRRNLNFSEFLMSYSNE